MKEPDIQEDTYNQFREYLEYPPYVSTKGMESRDRRHRGQRSGGEEDSKPEDFMDMRFVAELDK